MHIAGVDDDGFLVCSGANNVRLYASGDETSAAPPPATLRTRCGPVHALLHIRNRDLLVTVEPEAPQSAINVVRIYSNWRSKQPDSTAQCSFELPSHATVTCVAACPTTGRLAVATSSDVSLWSPCSDTTDNGKFEQMLQLECTGVCHLAVNGAFLAYATDHSVHVLECSVVPISSSASALPTASMAAAEAQPRDRLPIGGRAVPFAAIDDEFFVGFEVDTSTGNISAKPPVSTIDFSATRQSAAAAADEAFLVCGPLSEVGQAVRVESQFAVRSLQLLLHAQYPLRAGTVHSLFFLPEYSHIGSDYTEVGMRCFASTPTEGYLYNARQPGVLATYTYTNETVQCCSNDAFLFAITNAAQSGVEAFTLRTSMDVAEYAAPVPCLMGMQPFLGPRKMIVVGDYLVLLSKLTASAPPRGSPKASAAAMASKESTSWNLYMLHPTTLCTLYEDLLARANKVSSSDTMNAPVYYQLVLEGHILLQSKIVSLTRKLAQPSPRAKADTALRLSLQLEIKNYNILLRHSAALLGDYYFQHGKEYHKAAQCYSESDRKLVDVVHVFLQQEESRQALLEYLDRVLFDASMLEFMEEDPDVSNEILKHYVEFAPHRLSTVIIDSCLSAYSQRVALLLLDVAQEVRAQAPSVRADRRRELSSLTASTAVQQSPSPGLAHSSSSMHDIPPKDLFAKALLHLDLEEADAAQAVLQAIPGQNVVEFCAANPGIVSSQPGDTEPHVLATALRRAAPYALLDIVCRLGPETVPSAVLQSSADTDENQLLTMCFLENALMPLLEQLRKSRIAASKAPQRKSLTALRPSDALTGIAERLCAMYLARVIRSMRQPQDDITRLVQSPIAPHDIEVRLTGSLQDTCFRKWLASHNSVFAGDRLQWLDSIPPYGQRRLSLQPQQDAAMAALAHFPARGDSDQALLAYDYTHFYVRKMQGLVCSGLMGDTSQVATALEGIIAEQQQNSANKEDLAVLSALLALVLPLSSKFARRDSLSPMVTMFPAVSLDFGIQFCTGPEDWGLVLDTLLSMLRATTANPVSPTDSTQQSQLHPERRAMLETYDAVLEHTSVTLTPEQFLTLLPEDGDASFFLRHIERCCQQQLAQTLRSTILASTSC